MRRELIKKWSKLSRGITADRRQIKSPTWYTSNDPQDIFPSSVFDNRRYITKHQDHLHLHNTESCWRQLLFIATIYETHNTDCVETRVPNWRKRRYVYLVTTGLQSAEWAHTVLSQRTARFAVLLQFVYPRDTHLWTERMNAPPGAWRHLAKTNTLPYFRNSLPVSFLSFPCGKHTAHWHQARQERNTTQQTQSLRCVWT